MTGAASRAHAGELDQGAGRVKCLGSTFHVAHDDLVKDGGDGHIQAGNGHAGQLVEDWPR